MQDQTDSRSPRWNLAALGHPLWWGALALLLVNDNLLKGRGIVPGWLTGKLSDFAFLVVAPTLLAALLPLAVRGRRAIALLAVVAVYVAADLSRAASDAVVATAARMGLHWRLWPDVTDLLALAVLPITIWLLCRPRRASRQGRRERAGVVCGAIACLATSAPPRASYAPFLLNRTADAADVRITWVLRKVDCASTPEALAASLGPSDLDDPRAVSLASGQVAALDQPPLPGQSPAGQCRLDLNYGASSCVAAILESDGASPVVMLAFHQWEEQGSSSFITCDGPPPPSRCQPSLDPSVDPGPEAVSLLVDHGQARFAVSSSAAGAKVRIAPIDPAAVAARAPETDGCRELRDDYHAELGATACATSSDCDVVAMLELPGEAVPTGTCSAYLNKGTAADVRTLSQRFVATCQGSTPTCNPPDPSGCVGGRCMAICAGALLPWCPPSCAHYPGVDFGEGHACNSNIECFAAEGRRCACVAGVVTCKPDPPYSASCPYSCRPDPAYGDDGGYVDRTDAGPASPADAQAPVDGGQPGS